MKQASGLPAKEVLVSLFPFYIQNILYKAIRRDSLAFSLRCTREMLHFGRKALSSGQAEASLLAGGASAFSKELRTRRGRSKPGSLDYAKLCHLQEFATQDKSVDLGLQSSHKHAGHKLFAQGNKRQIEAFGNLKVFCKTDITSRISMHLMITKATEINGLKQRAGLIQSATLISCTDQREIQDLERLMKQFEKAEDLHGDLLEDFVLSATEVSPALHQLFWDICILSQSLRFCHKRFSYGSQLRVIVQRSPYLVT